MKKNIKYILPALIAFAFCSCQKEPQEEVIYAKDAAVKGELLVKFTADLADIIEDSYPTKAGIGEVDAIFEAIGAYEFERVFPVDTRHEARTRQAGLHQWYVVRFDSALDLTEVAGRLAALGAVSGVQYNHTIKRAYNVEKRAIPFDPTVMGNKTSVNNVFDDPYSAYQWNLKNDGTLWNRGFLPGADVNVENAWEKCTGDPSVIVAVLDEGILFNHPDLAESMWRNENEIFADHNDNDGNGYPGDYFGWNFVAENGQISNSAAADSGHGSHVAGIVAARNGNGLGINSIAGGKAGAPGVKVMSCQIFSGNSVASILDEVKAMKYAADNGAVILQCSWGYTSGKASPYDWSPQYADDDEWMADCAVEKEALMYFTHTAGSPNGPIDGGIAVFASGNEAAPAAGYPGAYKDFVSVIGTAPDFTPAVYTNYGYGCTICAPGGDQDYFYDYEKDGIIGEIGCILSTVPQHISPSGYAWFEGSSMATPHVSSALALAVSYAAQCHRHYTAEELKQLLYSTATPVDEYMKGKKEYYKYVADLGLNQKKKMDLDSYRGQMGYGQLNVSALLKAVKEGGAAMTFPNVLVATGAKASYDLGMYFDSTASASVVVEDTSVAAASVSGSSIEFTGLKEGITHATVKAGAQQKRITVTVKNNAAEGWM